MSYGAAGALQAAIYNLLRSDPVVVSLVGTGIFDAVPTGTPPDLYVSLGPEVAFAENDNTGKGSRHRFVVSVVSAVSGFLEAKSVAGAIADALHNVRPDLDRGRVVRIQFQKATARRTGSGKKRRIDLRFEARLEDD